MKKLFVSANYIQQEAFRLQIEEASRLIGIDKDIKAASKIFIHINANAKLLIYE